MSLRYEQYRALKKAREFIAGFVTMTLPNTKKEQREQAMNALRHYPPLREDGAPMFSEDEFTKG